MLTARLLRPLLAVASLTGLMIYAAVPAGSALEFTFGTRDLNAGSNVTGAGSVTMSGGTVSVNGGYAIAGTGTTTVEAGVAPVTGGPRRVSSPSRLFPAGRQPRRPARR
jgi:hypothetical protein